ncbi:MAG: hypothetical protein L0215_15015, partial [Gemmataceae bacterium]|nr:hypothetical protein [Gemmataceae bacterium]
MDAKVADPVEIPQPTGVMAEPWSVGKLWRLLGLFGPAAIVASVSIGAGETMAHPKKSATQQRKKMPRISEGLLDIRVSLLW